MKCFQTLRAPNREVQSGNGISENVIFQTLRTPIRELSSANGFSDRHEIEGACHRITTFNQKRGRATAFLTGPGSKTHVAESRELAENGASNTSRIYEFDEIRKQRRKEAKKGEEKNCACRPTMQNAPFRDFLSRIRRAKTRNFAIKRTSQKCKKLTRSRETDTSFYKKRISPRRNAQNDWWPPIFCSRN